MAFYPDELSPIDSIRNLGKQADSLPDIGPLKTRRQWKSLVLGKKDLGMNNFATIAEEKEEEISSEGSQAASPDNFASNTGAVTNKKITFPKPRKYITARVSESKEDVSLRGPGSSTPLSPLGFSAREPLDSETDVNVNDLSNASNARPKSNALELKQLSKPDKSKEFASFAQETIQNFALSETPIETQWNEAFSEGAGPSNWSRTGYEKTNLLKDDLELGSKYRKEERRKSSGSSKSSAVTEVGKREAKAAKKKKNSVPKESAKEKEELPSTSGVDKGLGGKGSQKRNKGKALNMKEAVNVYKNLAYGSKEEVKSFVENLSFVRDETRAESDKNLLSMMNLKALENKIKNFTKKSGKSQEPSSPQEKQRKVEKPAKKNRKAHVERLARHKVVKVPAVLNGNPQKNANESENDEKALGRREKGASLKDKEPWKYVGMQSILDKTYFVYPAYPPSVNLQNSTKAKKTSSRGAKKKRGSASGSKIFESESKVKDQQVSDKQNARIGGGVRLHCPNASGPPVGKGSKRPSAVTVCTVKFRPDTGPKTVDPAAASTDQSLLVYLHGTKAINVKSPYSDKQFSRVKFFRKDEKEMPLIKGITRRSPPRDSKTVSVRNIKLPEKLNRLKSLDLLDFDEDVQNITDFLSAQESPDRRRQGARKSEREQCPKKSPNEPGPLTSRYQRRQRPTTQSLGARLDGLHEHQRLRQRHGLSQDILSPDSIVSEISKNIQHLQYLPDTEDNRKMIGEFFDELDQRIEVSRKLSFQKFPSTPSSDSFGRVLVLGY